MKVTVEDISNFPEFADLKLIAGRGGLNKPVEKCGILDYEFVEGVREKWYNTNFRDENMIVMTSFLYAKDNEYLIMDAVKNLTSRKCSGLIIKNIFHLPIHENVIRYADTMNFPILVIEGSNIHFEDLIVLISERIRHYELLHYRESKVDEILRSGSDYRLLESISYDINPTFKTDMVAMFFKAKGQFGPREYLKMEKLIEDSSLMTASDSMFYYRDGFFIIHSRVYMRRRRKTGKTFYRNVRRSRRRIQGRHKRRTSSALADKELLRRKQICGVFGQRRGVGICSL